MGEDNTKMNQADHDLLIRLDTKMDRAATDIRNLGTSVADVGKGVHAVSESIDSKIAAAVAPKLDIKDFNEEKKNADDLHRDHETRLRFLERAWWLAVGALAILQLLLKFLPWGS